MTDGMCVCMYIYIYIYTHTHTNTHIYLVYVYTRDSIYAGIQLTCIEKVYVYISSDPDGMDSLDSLLQSIPIVQCF